MAKVFGPLLSLAATGKVGAGHLFKCTEKWQQFTKYKNWMNKQKSAAKASFKEKNPAFVRQQELFKQAAGSVRVMSDADRELWKEFSKKFKYRDDCTYTEAYVTYAAIAISFALVGLLSPAGKIPARPSQITQAQYYAWKAVQWNKQADRGFWLKLVGPLLD